MLNVPFGLSGCIGRVISAVHRSSRLLFIFVALLGVVACCARIQAQSTFGTIVGTVKGPSGQVIPGATVTLLNKGTNALRHAETDGDGTFQFTNLDVGSYSVTIVAAGFGTSEFLSIDLAGRENKRLDATLKIAAATATVSVEAETGTVVQTDTSNIAETKGSRELIDLPVAITSRASGSTSPMSTLTAQPGVQTDSQGNISVFGVLPIQVAISIDGISSIGPATLAPLSELFPSFNAIEEIRIGESVNPAEFGGVADITTISKSGTNDFHGGAFENLQNNWFNAADYFSHTVSPEKMNDFGVFLGGPVILPKLYSGRNRTFFFASVEALRLPKTVPVIESVPVAGAKTGDLSAYLAAPYNSQLYEQYNSANPGLSIPYYNNQIPQNQLNPYSLKALAAYFPSPNYGAPNAIANNLLALFPTPINSNQGDARFDQYLGTKNLIFARFTYKNRRVTVVPTAGYSATSPPTTPSIGALSVPEVDNAITGAWNYTITPNVLNELRVGYSESKSSQTFPFTAQQSATDLGLVSGPGALPNPVPQGGADIVPTISIAGFAQVFGQSQTGDQGTKQILDTVTWIKKSHTMKFGVDYRRMHGLFNGLSYAQLLGQYNFNGSVMSSLLGPGLATPLASFLLGYPDNSTVADNTAPESFVYAQHYSGFVQDDWRVKGSLTLNFGLRYEYHPTFMDKFDNVANFLPDYYSVIGGQTVRGALLVPGTKTLGIVNPLVAESIAPTPILTAAQAGYPSGLRYSQKTDFDPRIGFAWRLFGNDKTVLRGGYGRFTETLLSGAVTGSIATESSYVGTWNNVVPVDSTGAATGAPPQFAMPYAWPVDLAEPGSDSFYQATDLHYKDPFLQEWDLSVERDLGYGIGVRISYDGNHSSDLGVGYNLNQPPNNTVGFSGLTATPSARNANLPYSIWQYIQYRTNLAWGNYNAATVQVQKRMSQGLQFQASYIYARNLSNTNGVATASASAYQGEFGGDLATPLNPHLDYGNVSFSRRNRALFTFLYELPVGKGKTLLNSSNALTDRILGGWELGGVLVFQSGPFMTVSTNSDPCGCGYNVFNANGGRADVVAGTNPYSGKSINQWINPAAFADPGNAIGRFGNSSEGTVVGPGTNVVSLSMLKAVKLAESVRLSFGLQAANLLNHPNFAPPNNLDVSSPAGFGQLTAMQSAEGAGPRTLQLTGRITF